MQTCSRCNTETNDTAKYCPACQADLRIFSNTSVTIRRFRENPRIRNINLIVHEDACPACKEIQGSYAKDQAPLLPVEGCSCDTGCRCFYQPLIEEVFP